MRQILEQLQESFGEVEIAISVVTVVELIHGTERAKDEQSRARRQAFVDEVVRDVPAYPVTVDIAMRAGTIEGKQAARGLTIAFEDLLIGATALHLGFAVATSNIRHFQNIPGLAVVAT